MISAGETATGVSNITKTIIFQKAVESLFRIGRSRVEYGKIVPVSDVDDLISKVRSTGINAPKFTPDFIKQAMAVTNVKELQDKLKTIPSGEPFSDMENDINNAQDVATFLATKKIVIEILAKLATERRAGGFGQALKKAVGDISQAAGVDV